MNDLDHIAGFLQQPDIQKKYEEYIKKEVESKYIFVSSFKLKNKTLYIKILRKHPLTKPFETKFFIDIKNNKDNVTCFYDLHTAKTTYRYPYVEPDKNCTHTVGNFSFERDSFGLFKYSLECIDCTTKIEFECSEWIL